jgi:hypothetical protein
VDKFSFRLHGEISQKSVFPNMYHDCPSDNIRTENFNNEHLLKEDFGTSVEYVGGISTFVMSIDNGVRNDYTIISQARPNR